jgi:predicted transposase YbfD/YdcC
MGKPLSPSSKRPTPRALWLVIEHFGELKDPRIDRTKRHPLANVLVMSLCGAIAGAETWDDLERFCEAREDWFGTFLDVSGGTPSADTFRRVFERLAPSQFGECFRNWVAALAVDFRGEVVAIDGKTLRGQVEKAGKKTQLHLVHVWATEQRLLLGQKAVDGASGEMAAIPELLQRLDLEGAIITTDAASCTAPVTRAIVEAKADYVLAVKGNRGRFYDHVVGAFAGRERFAKAHRHEWHDEGHGRREKRVVSVLEPKDWPWETKKNGAWAGLRTAVRIERTREVIGEETNAEVHFFVSTLPPNAKRIGEAIRAHWGVENHLHWQLDVAFADDRRRVRDARSAENLATVSRLALMLLKHAPARIAKKASIRGSRKLAAWDNRFLAQVLTSANSIP